jgi:pyridinium-3,5-biscarboxylic acid mononucleotide sulfurtransferase
MNEVGGMKEALDNVLRGFDSVAVAVSGGVDSMTLAWFAHRNAPQRVAVFHALSPAVPTGATARVRDYAEREGWRLEVIDAGEFSDPAYRANPVDRCFHCKSHLDGSISAHTRAGVVSGTNLDDLSDYRPGLVAARERGIRHPYVEAGIDKAGVRALARHFNLRDLAELPASPCLSSRVETGIRIEASQLVFIDRIETLLRTEFGASVVRCRLRRDGPVIELDDAALARIASADGEILRVRLDALCHGRGAPQYESYRRGSAFVQL